MTEYIGDKVISGIAYNTKYNAHHLLDFKWTDCIMNDVSWLRADTFSWQSGDVYVTAYNHLVQDIQGITAETETIGSYTVTFYRATDGHKICLADQEQTVLNIYNTYGIAWYYILDTTNTQFKLPRTKYGFEGLRTNVGDKIDESLPNIKGDIGYGGYGFVTSGLTSGQYYNGAFTASKNHEATFSGSGADETVSVSFNAHSSNSTYQDNAPVQERATQMYLYFYVGDYTQTAIEQTAGLNSELFNGKADVNLANVNNQAKIFMSGMGMPSGKYVNLTLGASGSSYIVPADGWFCLRKNTTGSTQYIYMQSSGIGMYSWATSNYPLAMYIPAKKDSYLYVEYTAAGTTLEFTFNYAVGSESEAS